VKGTGLPRKNVHWVETKLVAQIAFSEWTQDGKLRHPRFLGLRDDKKPGEVVREN
jgi:ATP-dependent DNA ligase